MPTLTLALSRQGRGLGLFSLAQFREKDRNSLWRRVGEFLSRYVMYSCRLRGTSLILRPEMRWEAMGARAANSETKATPRPASTAEMMAWVLPKTWACRQPRGSKPAFSSMPYTFCMVPEPRSRVMRRSCPKSAMAMLFFSASGCEEGMIRTSSSSRKGSCFIPR